LNIKTIWLNGLKRNNDRPGFIRKKDPGRRYRSEREGTPEGMNVKRYFMDIQPLVDEMIEDFINCPVRKQGTGEGCTKHSLETRILPDGRILEVQLVITTIKEDQIVTNENYPH
jgi:hypothetical protein